MFHGEMDSHNAFLDIQAGAGGTEAQDWAQMLLRMYLRWGEPRGFAAEVIDSAPGEVAGIKSATIKFKGEYAYGWLRTETGVHRLVRKSPFDSERSPPHLVRLGVRLAGGRRRHRHRDQSGRPRDGRLSLERRRRPARQQDRVRGAHHARADRHRRGLPERAQPAQEPLDRDEDAEGEALRARSQQAQRRGARCSRTRSRT